MRRLPIPLLLATVAMCCLNAPRSVNAQVSTPIQSTATQSTRLCLNAKTGAITPQTRCTRAERIFTASAYLKEIKKVSDNVASLTTSVEAFPLPNLVMRVAPSGPLINTVQDALVAANAAARSASSPILIKLAPGTYALPADGITLPSHAFLEGSGMGTTILQASGTTGLLWGRTPE